MSTLSFGLSRIQRRSNTKTNHFHQTVIVTGGATGIGYAVAAQFVERGANVLLNGRIRAKLAGAAEKLRNSDRVAFIAADITQPANAQTIVDAALERFGRLDVLVNNAGIFYNKPFTDYTVEDLDAFLGYLRGTFVLTQSAAQAMRQQPEGSSGLVFGVARFPLAPVALEMIFESAR